jgi:hypothetical protein
MNGVFVFAGKPVRDLRGPIYRGGVATCQTCRKRTLCFSSPQFLAKSTYFVTGQFCSKNCARKEILKKSQRTAMRELPLLARMLSDMKRKRKRRFILVTVYGVEKFKYLYRPSRIEKRTTKMRLDYFINK